MVPARVQHGLMSSGLDEAGSGGGAPSHERSHREQRSSRIGMSNYFLAGRWLTNGSAYQAK
jgi:hypothetical protein